MQEMNLRNYAHIGDALWELFVREYTVFKTNNLKLLHNLTTERVNSKYQSEMLLYLKDFLTEDENEIARRARNCPIPVARRNNQTEYRQSTAFEALLGYWYLNNKERYKEITEKIRLEFFSE